MRRVIQLLANIAVVGGLLLGAALLLFNLALSPAWKDANTGWLPSDPIRWILYAENSPLNQSRIIQTVCLWARLDPLPKSARNLIVDSSGELFDKRYTVTFRAAARDINTWLMHSAGTAEQAMQSSPQSQSLLQSQSLDDRGDRHYPIQPRDAAFAEVTVLADQQTVKIKAAWSESVGDRP